MDLRQTAESLFPKENVAGDFRSYEAMAKSWKIKEPVPTMDALDAQWAELQKGAYAKNRRDAYLAEGMNAEALVVALWEKVVEGRPERSDALQAKRVAIKIKFPKPS